MTELLTALALAMALEGAVYALVPGRMKAVLARVLAMPDSAIRATGLAALALGVGIVWLLRG